jgi:hypothetical protein
MMRSRASWLGVVLAFGSIAHAGAQTTVEKPHTVQREGRMTIIITDGKHSYDFAYTLPEGH